MAEPVPLSAEFISSLPGTLSLPVPNPQRSLSLPSRGSNAPPLDFLSSSHFESISLIFFSGSFIFPFAEDEKRVILTLCPAASFISLTADVSIWRERSLFSSSDMQSKTALPTFFASFPSMSALTAVFIIADEDENSPALLYAVICHETDQNGSRRAQKRDNQLFRAFFHRSPSAVKTSIYL